MPTDYPIVNASTLTVGGTFTLLGSVDEFTVDSIDDTATPVRARNRHGNYVRLEGTELVVMIDTGYTPADVAGTLFIDADDSQWLCVGGGLACRVGLAQVLTIAAIASTYGPLRSA